MIVILNGNYIDLGMVVSVSQISNWDGGDIDGLAFEVKTVGKYSFMSKGYSTMKEAQKAHADFLSAWTTCQPNFRTIG